MALRLARKGNVDNDDGDDDDDDDDGDDNDDLIVVCMGNVVDD